MLHGALAPSAALLAGAAAGWASGAAVPAGAVAAIAAGAWVGAALLLRRRVEGRFVAAALAGFAICGAALGGTARTELRTPLLGWYAAYRAAEPRTGGPRRVVRVEGVLRRDALRTGYGASLVIDVERVNRPRPGGSRARGRAGLRRRPIRGGPDRRMACRPARPAAGRAALAPTLRQLRDARPESPPADPRHQPAGIGEERPAGRGHPARAPPGRVGVGRARRRAPVGRAIGRRAQHAVRRHRDGGAHRGSGRARSGDDPPPAGGGHLPRHRDLGWEHRDPGGPAARRLPARRRGGTLRRALRRRGSRGLRTGGGAGAVRRSRDVHRRHVPARAHRRPEHAPPQHAGACGRMSRGRLAGATGRSRIPAHVRRDARDSHRAPSALRVGGRVNRGRRLRAPSVAARRGPRFCFSGQRYARRSRCCRLGPPGSRASASRAFC